MTIQRARELIQSMDGLPTLPEVVIHITHLVESPTSSAEDIYKVVSTDVSLTATMLRLVNSAYYGVSRQVTSLETAIKILGFSTVKGMALAAFVFDAFSRPGDKFDYRGFWLHSIGVASASKALARRQSVKDPADYFVYGLLHDLGIVALMSWRAEDLEAVRRLAAGGKPFNRAEEAVLGATHSEIGATLAESWNFPPALVSIIAAGVSQRPTGQYAREIAVVSVADLVAAALLIGSPIHSPVSALPEQVFQLAGVSSEQIGKVLDETAAEMENSRQFVDLLNR